MGHLNRRRAATALAGALGSLACARSSFAAWPDAPGKIVLPFAPAGSADLTARLVAAGLSDRLGQPFVVENRPGAGGQIGVGAIVRSKPDGLSLLVTPNGPITIVNQVQKPQYDVEKDLAPVSLLVQVPVGVAVSASLGVSSVAGLIKYARSNSGPLIYGIPAIATHMHLVGAMFGLEAGINLTPVPFGGTSQAGVALLSGQVQMAFGDLTSLLPLRDSGVKIIAVCDPARTAVAPDLPTVAESGLPGFGLSAWIGFFAPQATPPDILVRLEKEARGVIAQPDTRATLIKAGLEPMGGGSAELRDLVRSDIRKLARVIKDAGISAP